MKLIKRTTLHFREGTSDKVYEVDLCEVGANAFVVNFRYGRRGMQLKEGSKTISPVTQAEADKIAAALLAEKTKKGYREVTADVVNSAPIPVKALKVAANVDARAQAVLNRLRAPQAKSDWQLNRVIWRAGELRIAEAAPLLVSFIGSEGALRDYCIAWSLGWCGDAQAISALGMLANDVSRPTHVRAIALEAVRKLSPAATSVSVAAEWSKDLPAHLQTLAQQGPAEQFSQSFFAYIANGEAQAVSLIGTLYLINNEHVRPALLHFARTAPLQPNTFRQLRHLFKTAEYRRDAELFGLIAYRFEKSRAMYAKWHDNPRANQVTQYGSTLYGPKHEQTRPDTKYAYSDITRRYLRQRVWRTLRRLGEINDPDYVKMAVGVLLPYSDADAQDTREVTHYRYDESSWQRYAADHIRWDRFAAYIPLNHILYLNSPRYQHKPGTIAWRCRKGYKPGDPEPPVREEAFPLLWEAAPAGMLHLLSESQCLPVHQFAVKALRACAAFIKQLDNETVIMLLTRPYETTAKFGFELAQAHYNANAPDLNLVLAVADCLHAEARATAQRWIAESRQHFQNAGGFLANIVTSQHADMREFARKFLQSAELSTETTRTLIVRLIAFILVLDRQQETLAREIAATLQTCFARQMRNIGMEVVRDLLDHPLLAAQELGGFLLLNHTTPADELPETVIQSLIASPHESMRAIGIKLFGKWPDERLLRHESLITAFATHELADIRQSIRPVIERLSQNHADFAQRVADTFLNALLRREPHTGVHRALVQMLKQDLGTAWMASVARPAALQFTFARSTDAQDLGAYLLQAKLEENAPWLTEFSTNELTKLSNHEIKQVRDAAQALFLRNLDRYRAATNPSGHQEELAQAVRLLDVNWDETREFYFKAFAEHFTAEELTPGLLVSICDSVRPDVQKFGRDMISRYFADADGQEYLLKLSEHPTTDLQLFATNYLERYAANDAARLNELRPYFISVLARVNCARVAKSRVLAFLATEAHKSAEAAAIVAEILTRQSVTMAIGDKAATIETMLAIRRTYPAIELPLQIQAVQQR